MVRPVGFKQRVFVVTTLTIGAPTAAQVNVGVEITPDLPAPINFSGTTNYMTSSSSVEVRARETGTPLCMCIARVPVLTVDVWMT